MRTLVIATVALAALIPAAQAQTPAPTPQALTDVYTCAQIQDSDQRLQCYDGAVGRLRQAETQGQVVAVDRAQVQELRRDSFGFQLPSLSRLMPNLGNDDEPVNTIQMTVTRVREGAYGYHSFVMDNGQVWEQIEPQSARNVRPGDVITIERGMLSSFRLISPRGGAGHRVRRQS